MHDKNKDLKIKNLTVSARAVFRTQSKVYGGAKKAPPEMLDCVACKEKRNKLTYITLHTFT